MIDFRELKQHCSIEEVARGFLQMKLTDDGKELRAPCPHCKSDDPRAIIITPSKGLFYCFTARKGGDLISLVSHCHSTNVRESAEALAKVYMAEEFQEEPKAKEEPKATKGFDPLKYIGTLKREQEDVSEFGLTAEICEESGMGLCTKGINRGKLTVPIRTSDGTIIGFIGVSGDVSAPKKWRMA